MKKLLAIALSCAMVVGLSACGGGASGSSSAADSDDNAVLAPVAPVARRSRMKSVSVMASSYCSDLGVGVTRWFCSFQPDGAVGRMLV